MLRIVSHTVPRVGRCYEHFPDGFELHPLQPRACNTGVNGSKGEAHEEGHVRRRVLDKYGRVHKFVLGTSYMHINSKMQR